MSIKKYNIKLNGKVYEVEIEEILEEKKDVSHNIEKKIDNKEPNIEKLNTSENAESITAPMPGTILNILVKKDEKVKKGQVLAILEAMKMENEIISPVDGKIEDINVDKGQNVSLGDKILELM